MIKGEIIIFSSIDNIVESLKKIVINLNDKKSLEDYNVFNYLLGLSQNSLYQFPFQCKKWDSPSPDFLVEYNHNNPVGIETTHVTVNFHFKNMKDHDNIPGSFVESSSNGRSYLRKADEQFCSEPYYGNQAEKLWVEIAMKEYRKKREKFIKPFFRKETENVLLIRNFTSLPIKHKNIPAVINAFYDNIKYEFNNSNTFNEITVIWGDNRIFRNINGIRSDLIVNI